MHEERAIDTDLRRQVVTVITYVVTVAINMYAVLLPLNGQTTGEISDRFPVLITPADWEFRIWTVIYVLLALFVVYQALPARRRDPELRAIGYLPALTGVLNAAWVVAWHLELFVLTVPLMVALLLTLVAIHVQLREVRRAGGAPRWLVALPFSVYLGWITVATISQMLFGAGYRGEPLGEGLWALLVLATGLAITSVMLLREADWAYALVIIWAYVGIAANQDDPLAVLGAILGALAVAILVGRSALRPRLAGASTTGPTAA